VFVVASAMVSFNGWPQLGAESTPVAVVSGHTHGVASRSAVRRFVAATSAELAAINRPAVAAAPTVATQAPSAGRPSTAVVAGTPLKPSGSGSPTFTATANPNPPPPPAPCQPCAKPSLSDTLAGATRSATSQLGKAVTTTGSNLGSVVTGLTGAVAGKLGAVNPALGQIVQQTGQALGNTVTTATNLLGTTVSGTGNSVAGLIAHK
jgi:hypothetical protein